MVCSCVPSKTASLNCAGLRMSQKVPHNKVSWCAGLQAGSSSRGTRAPGLPLSEQRSNQGGR